jgi:hypothetical protein
MFIPGAIATEPTGMTGVNAIERSTNQAGQVSINGNRNRTNNYLLDGIEINETINNVIGYNPSPDAIGNLTVITSNAGAEYGNVNGGDVSGPCSGGLSRRKSAVHSRLGRVCASLSDPLCRSAQNEEGSPDRLSRSGDGDSDRSHARHTTTNMRNAAREIYRYWMPMDKPALVISDTGQIAGIASHAFAYRRLKEMGYFPDSIIRKPVPLLQEYRLK